MKRRNTALVCATIVGSMFASPAFAAERVVASEAKSAVVDFANAKPKPLPQSAVRPTGLVKAATATKSSLGGSGGEAGSMGNGSTNPVTLPVAPIPRATTSSGTFTSQQYGYTGHPFTTARADGKAVKVTSDYPWRAAGKLFFKDGTSSYVCSASLIKKGVVVTAAHCVTLFDSPGTPDYTGHQFVPGYSKGAAPYGTWTSKAIYVMSSYKDGTDSCYSEAPGVVCENDVALIVLTPKSGRYPGTSTGWFGYYYGGQGFPDFGGGPAAQITQLGYPVALDYGKLMERTDSLGYLDPVLTNNTVIGSQQTGGSSGGPWLVNFGTVPTVTDAEATAMYDADANRIVGVTSWGYVGGGYQEQGASPFLETNIVALLTTACTAYPAACAN